VSANTVLPADDAAPRDVAAARPPRVWLILAAILAVGLVARVALWQSFAGVALHHDEVEYNEIAAHLAEEGRFAAAQGQLTSIRPPLFPASVAAIYRLFGVGNFQAVRAAQGLLSLGTVVLVFLLARRLYDERVALWAAGLVCFYPSLLVYNNLLLSETLFTFWLTAIVLAIVSYLQSPSLAKLTLVGALVGVGALTRSILWLFPPVLGGYLLIAAPVAWPRRLAGAALMVVAFLVVIAPWAWRNTRLEKTLITIDCMGGRNLMMGNYEHTPLTRSWDAIGVGGEQAWYRVLARRYPEFRQMTQGQRDKLAMREGIRFVLAHPGLTIQRDVIKFFNFWQLERELVSAALAGEFGAMPKPAVALIALIVAGGYAVVILLAITGAVLFPPEDWRANTLLLLMMAYICLLHTLVFAHSRYHLPLVPLLVIYAASAIAQRQRLLAFRGKWQGWLAGAIVLVLVGGWVTEIITVDIARIQERLG
jgi:4-amino-4-deoxy-L-arabinose transferase-like glycosyltransferase